MIDDGQRSPSPVEDSRVKGFNQLLHGTILVRGVKGGGGGWSWVNGTVTPYVK